MAGMDDVMAKLDTITKHIEAIDNAQAEVKDFIQNDHKLICDQVAYHEDRLLAIENEVNSLLNEEMGSTDPGWGPKTKQEKT